MTPTPRQHRELARAARAQGRHAEADAHLVAALEAETPAAVRQLRRLHGDPFDDFIRENEAIERRRRPWRFGWRRW